MDKPSGLEPRVRALTRLRNPGTEDWANSYLTAFATAGQLTLVTFDRALCTKVKPFVLLNV